MNRRRTALSLVLSFGALALAACGGGTLGESGAKQTLPGRAAPPDSAVTENEGYEYSYGESAEPGSAPQDGWFDDAAQAPSASAESSASRAPRSADALEGRGHRFEPQGPAIEPSPPVFRPGLATSWGETRESSVRFVSFTRHSDQPAFVSQLFYNDRAGVEAMVGSRRDVFRGFTEPDAPLTVRLVDASGAPFPMLEVDGRRYAMGEEGARYLIQIENNTGRRFEAVASVDGLDVIDGRAASFDNRGYLVGPWATVTIDGFRRSTETVAAFRFGSVGESYAASKGAARNVGVIGVAMFPERGRPFVWDREEARRRHAADPFPGRFAEPPR